MSENVSIPAAPRRPHVWRRPTGPVTDPFAWMRDHDDPALHEYLVAENRHSAAWFEPHEGLVETIFGEIRGRVQEDDLSVPVRFGPWWYVTRTSEGASYHQHLRGPSATRSTEQLLLDENVEAEGAEFFDLGAFDVSSDHERLAWSSDATGDEHYRLRIRDLRSGTDLDDIIDDVANAGTAWSADGRELFYVTADEHERPCTVWRHRVGSPATDDVVVFDETDDAFYVGIGTTRSQRFVVIHSASINSAEARLIPTSAPTDPPRVVRRRRADVEYSVDDWGDRIVMLTNDAAIDFRILSAAPDADLADDASWTEIDPGAAGRRIVAVEPFRSHLAIVEWADAQPRIRIRFRDRQERTITVTDEPHDIDLSASPEWTTETIRFVTQSLTDPPSVHEEPVTGGERRMLKRTPTPNVDLDAYVAERTWATSDDGTQVPVDVVRHVDTPLDGTAPYVVYGYGAYEASLAPGFSAARLSLLDRGVVWALVHARGGGELGRRWYLDGKLMAKRNTFTDVLTAVDHLAERFSLDARRCALRGASAGGLLVGACVTMRPERFAAAIAEVPFVDVVNSMSDPTLPLTVIEWDEWGDPRTEPAASYIADYSPYDNTTPAAYPAMYVSAGLNDPRVSVHEPAKWVARLREVGRDGRPIVLRTEMGAGHGGPSGRYDAWRDEAHVLAFLLVTL